MAVSIYFYREFQKNWTPIQAAHLELHPVFLAAAFAAVVMTYLLTTLGWLVSVTSLSANRITFAKSVAIVNVSNLTKYIPGKVWSYALQMYWLEKEGVSKTLVLYVNVLNLGISIVTALILGLCFLVLSPASFPVAVTLPMLLLLVLADLIFLRYGSALIDWLIFFVNRLLRLNLSYFQTSTRLLLRLHAICFAADFVFGLGAYLLSRGIGFEVPLDKVLPVMSSMMISEVAGVLAVIAPGGLGVREGAMYLLLKGPSFEALALMLPLGTRVLGMLVDLFLGGTGFLLFQRFKRTENVE